MESTGPGYHREEFFKRFPSGFRLDEALVSPDNPTPLFFFHKSKDPDLKDCVLVIGRLGREIEHKFGLTSEVVFLFLPYRDMQRRSFNALTSRAREELANRQIEVSSRIRFTPDRDIAFIISNDERATEKMHEWNTTGTSSFAIPVSISGLRRHEIRKKLIEEIALVLEERDLYRGRNPVTGNAFFGRNDMLQRIASGVREGRSMGLFGLRRSGKTSILREYQLRRRGASEIVILSDLESMSSLHGMASQIGEDLNEALRKRKDSGLPAFIGGADTHSVDGVSDLTRRIRYLAGRNTELRFVIALDEVESLKRFADDDPDGTRSLLGALRQGAQAEENVTLLFTGITTRFFTESTLARGVDNPLFGFVDPLYLRPFEQAESRNLIVSLGKKMLMSWDMETADAVHMAAGGFPFLVRDLASRVRKIVSTPRESPLDVLPVSVDDVEAAQVGWAEESAVLWSGIVDSLNIHHPIMGALLNANSAEIQQWLEAGPEAEADARALEKLGLFCHAESGYEPTKALKALQGLGKPAKKDFETIQRDISAADAVVELIERGESKTLEFKATARINLHTGQRDEKIELGVVKTICGFLNAEGGTLLIGVEDSGTVTGIGKDLQLHSGNLDGYQNWLQANVLGKHLGDAAVAEFVRVTFPSVHGQKICRVDVSKASEPVWTNLGGPGSFYVRTGNATKQLHGPDQFKYVSNHWRHS